MVDIVDFAATVAQLDQHADNREDVVVGEGADAFAISGRRAGSLLPFGALSSSFSGRRDG